MKNLLLCLILCGLSWASDQPAAWLDVPFVKQEKDGCGSASISMVMQYWLKQQQKTDAGADPVAIQRALFSKANRGILASSMEEYFRDHGFSTFAFAGAWEILDQQLEKGRPLIIALKPSELSKDLHYVVVAGVDSSDGVVLVNDPAQRKLLKEARPEFERQWSAAGKWTLLAVPR